jgi:hypothetical protein
MLVFVIEKKCVYSDVQNEIATFHHRYRSQYPLLCPHLKSVVQTTCHIRHFLLLGVLSCAAANTATTPDYCFLNCLLSSLNYLINRIFLPIPVAARSKAWVCGRSLTGIVGSNLTGGMDVCLLSVLCVVR